MFATEKNKRLGATQNLTTSSSAAQTTPIGVGHVVDLFLRLAATADSYINVIPARSGSFTLNPAGAGSTAAIDANASAADIQAALATTLASNSKTTVTGTGTAADPFLITFVGALGLSAQTLTKVSTGIVNATLTQATVQAGDGTHNQQFSLIFAGTPSATSTNGALMPAGTIDYIRVEPGAVVSALQVTAAGVVSVNVVEP